MPFSISQLYKVVLTNREINIDLGVHYERQGYHKVILNVNHYFGYPSDMAKYKQQLLSLSLDYIKPVCLVIENEELYSKRSIETYCEMLKTAVETLPAQKVTNGGLTMPELGFWYMSLTGDPDFFLHNMPTNRKQPFLDGLYTEAIQRVQTEMDALKSLKIAFVNVHIYIGYANQVAGLVRMINYVKEYTGKEVISDESGIYAPDLLISLIDIAKQTNMSYLILYCGNDKTNALPITLTDYQTITAEI